MSATSSHFKGTDGRDYVSINVATHRVFARACLDEMQAQGQPSKHYLLRIAKSISVPVDILDGARRRLAPEERADAE
jgi:hypothetical protein